MRKLKTVATKVCVCIMAAAMSLSIASAKDVVVGSDSATYSGVVATTEYTPAGSTEAKTYSAPSTKDRCSLRYYGVDKYKVSADDVKITAYHIIEGNYNQYGFLGWTETKAAYDAGVELATFQKTSENVVQVVVKDSVDTSDTYNKGLVITSENITDLASAILSDSDVAATFETVDLTWSETENCYKTDDAEAGTYLVLVEKEDKGIIYNPVIISNDYTNANIAASLSNITASADATVPASLHDEFDEGKVPYEAGVNEDNTAFVTYGSFNPVDVTTSLVTGDNKDKAPSQQSNYLDSRSLVTYYKDTQISGNVYSVYKGNTDDTKIETMALAGKAYAKKSTVPFEKNIVEASVPKTYANTAEEAPCGYSKYDDVSEGDEITYDIYTAIPYYSDGYYSAEQNFLFAITDTQHDGLKAVEKANISVYVAPSSKTNAQAIASDIVKDANLVAEGDDTFKITLDADGNSFTVSFAKDYVLENVGASIVVRYNTTVTDNAALGLNGNPNEAYLEYTTAPTTPTTTPEYKRGHKFDFAVAYTFSPTAFKLAENGEVVKNDDLLDNINSVTDETQADIAKGQLATKPLAGAKFKLQRVGTFYDDENGVTETAIAPDLTKWNANANDPKLAENGYQTWFLTSDDEGVITFDSERDGIDEGIYTLQEIEAPKDYTINEKIYVISVKPAFDERQQFIGTDVKMKEEGKNTYEGMTFVDGTNYLYDAEGKLLDEYTYSEWVSEQADSYDGILANLAPVGDKLITTVNYRQDGVEKEAHTDLIGIFNTKLTRLPSTGGIGTIIFTVAGLTLMGAAIVIFSKRKENEN